MERNASGHDGIRARGATLGQAGNGCVSPGAGADLNKAGAPWSTPLAWAQKKGHTSLAADLVAAANVEH